MKKFLKIILVISLFAFLLLIIFQYSSLNINYFETKLEENNTEIVTGIEKEKLLEISKEIIKYLDGERDDLNIKITEGEEAVFGEREIEHMKDVRDLFDKGFIIKNALFLTAIISFLILKFYYKENLSKTLLIGGIIFSFLLMGIGVIIVFNFNKAFVVFHQVLFNNDLWILNPKEDVLIQMLPSNFFSDLGILIVKRYIITVIIFSISMLVLIKRKNNKTNNFK
ncbi:MAG: TIGR01906 family membrane protein [Bacillota bacterium]|nr:TIGR01906 family membrane protein [Bacillota bacterium]